MTGIPASDVSDYASREFPEVFAACRLADDGTIVVLRKQGNPEFERAVRSTFPDLTLRFENARFSKDEADAIVERIRADLPGLETSGARIVAYGPRPDGAGAFVAALNVEVTERLISARYGDMVTVKASGGMFRG